MSVLLLSEAAKEYDLPYTSDQREKIWEVYGIVLLLHPFYNPNLASSAANFFFEPPHLARYKCKTLLKFKLKYRIFFLTGNPTLKKSALQQSITLKNGEFIYIKSNILLP